MTNPETGKITLLLQAHFGGDREAFDQLVPMVYQQLQRMARQQLRKMPRGQTLDTVALVHEAYLRLVDETGVEWQSRSHFYAITARAMRWIVVDHARRKSSQKRGGDLALVTLEPELIGAATDAEGVLAINDALDVLSSFNERLAQIVECRFFGGMTDAEIGEALAVSERTVQRDWQRARAWLLRSLSQK